MPKKKKRSWKVVEKLYPDFPKKLEMLIIKSLADWLEARPLYKILTDKKFKKENPEAVTLLDIPSTDGKIMSFGAFHSRLKRLEKKHLKAIIREREKMWDTLADVRLADPKQRLLELVKLYEAKGQKPVERAKILNQIKEELNEEKWQDVFTQMGKVTKTEEKQEQTIEEVAAVLNRATKVVDISKIKKPIKRKHKTG